ncbi:Nucleoporin nup84 [Coemansia sp. RSA 2530]|nr:Nucleoporin nup84 [Coemansia sp. RSA 2530]
MDIVAKFAAAVDAHSGREGAGLDSDTSTPQTRAYRQVAKQQLEALKGEAFAARGPQDQNSEAYWKTESNTWDLVERLYKLRAQALAEAQDDDMSDGDSGQEAVATTDYAAVQELMGRSNLLAEYMEVKRWLEETAPEFQAVETRKGYLFYTRRSIARSGARDSRIVTEADPDATSRQRRELAPEDAEYSAGLVRTLYEYVRRGRVSSAIDLCVESDEAWRAATLKGSLVWRDPVLEPSDIPGTRPPHTAGNINRALWKHACAALAADEANDMFERALYAALSGRIDEVALVCEGWDDHLWAHVNALIEARVDRTILDSALLYTPAQTAALGHIPSRYMPARDLSQVIDALACHDSPALRYAAAEPFRRLQSAIIVDKFPAYLGEYAEHLRATESTDADVNLLRVVVHIALLLRRLGFALPLGAVADVLERYIDLLASNNRHLVAVYVAHLPPSRQTEAYALFLRGVDDPLPVRMQLLVLAETHGLDVDAIAKLTAQLVLDKHSDSRLPAAAAYALAEPIERTSDAESEQIRAIEWITAFPRLYCYALVEICNLARRFLLCGRTNAAAKLFNSLPDDFVQPEWIVKARLDDTSAASHSPGSSANGPPPAPIGALPEATSHVHEYIQMLSLCDAYHYYSTWAEAMCKRPTNPASQLSARMQAQCLEWKERAVQTTDHATLMFRSRLIDIDWLSPQSLCIAVNSPSDNSQTSRLEELARLRELYIPETVFRLHSILFDSRDILPQNLKRSLDLAQLVADESLGIYHQLAKPTMAHPLGRLTAFLGLMRRSAFEILRIQQLSQPDKPPLLADSTLPASVGRRAIA